MKQQWNTKIRSRVRRVVAIYVVFSLFWIYCSDEVLNQFISDPDFMTRMSIFKGFLFVLISAVLLWQLITGYSHRLVETHQLVLESEERFQAIFDGFSDGVFIYDLSGVITDVNPTACTMYGYPREDLIGQGFAMISLGTAFHSGGEAAAALNLSAGKTQLIEWLTRNSSGNRFWIEVSMRRITLQGQELILAIVRDISERKRTMDKLHETENLFATAFRVSPDSININRLSDGTYLQINEGFTHITGYSEQDVIGRTSLEIGIWVNSRDRKMLVKGLQEKGVVNNLEARFRKKNGDMVIGLMSARTIELDGEPCILSIVRDITERRQFEQQNLRSAQLASIGQLAAGVAHEINNPINGVINYAQLLLNRTTTGKTSDEILQLIIKEGDRVAEIVKELLFFSRDSKDQFSVVWIEDLFKSVLTLTRKYIERHGIQVETDLEAGLPPLMIIPQKIEHVLINLMNNASHALDEKFPAPHPDKLLQLQARRVRDVQGEFCRLVVRDQGCGIPADLLDRIEQPFFSTKSAGEGVGLGMSICREIVGQHLGKMLIESVEGEYTAVIIDLPIRSNAAYGASSSSLAALGFDVSLS